MPITPYGTEYTVRHRIVKVNTQTSGKRSCNLMNVFIANSGEYIKIPCFNCSGFPFTYDYYAHQEDRLTTALLRAPNLQLFYPCARKVAEDIVQRCAFATNKAQVDARACFDAITTTQLVGVALKTRRQNEDYSKEMKMVKVDALMRMVDAKEADRRGRGWVATEHRCSVCLEEIERPWFSLTVPSCGHIFHEKCLVRWLYGSNECPLCSFELPTED